MNAQPRRVEHQQTDKGSVPVYTTAIVEQPWSSYRPEDHATWAALFLRQNEILRHRAAREFIDNQKKFGMTPDAIPKFDDLNKVLRNATGWELIGVEGLLPELTFFDHLANRRFPVTWWIRRPDQIDYISEPDLFHDLFGHVPLLIDPVFADYMQAYGRTALAVADDEAALARLARLYWYTVEFGLIRNPNGTNGLSIYGAGIVSSKGESLYSLESAAPNRLGFELERVMRTKYRIDTFQKTYFVIDDFAQLFNVAQTDFAPLLARLAAEPAFAAGDVLEHDRVMTRGSREGWLANGDI